MAWRMIWYLFSVVLCSSSCASRHIPSSLREEICSGVSLLFNACARRESGLDAQMIVMISKSVVAPWKSQRYFSSAHW